MVFTAPGYTGVTGEFLIYSDSASWMDFQLQVTDDTLFNGDWQTYHGYTDGFAMMSTFTYDTTADGSDV